MVHRRYRRSGTRPSLAVLVLMVAAVHANVASAQSGDGGDTPNIVLFLSDDMGWGQPGFNGGDEVDTPSIDRIAEEGIRLTQFYVAPVCTATRGALVTGRYSWKNGTGVRFNGRTGMGMRVDERTTPNSAPSSPSWMSRSARSWTHWRPRAYSTTRW